MSNDTTSQETNVALLQEIRELNAQLFELRVAMHITSGRSEIASFQPGAVWPNPVRAALEQSDRRRRDGWVKA